MRGAQSLSWRGPLLATLVVAAAYLLWAGWYVAGQERELTDLAHVGQAFIDRGDSSNVIERLQPQHGDPVGYDGQFFMYIALAPLDATDYLDHPAYRYSRILYPALALAVAAGDPNVIPLTLLLVNVAAVIGATLALARLFQRKGISHWFALLFGLYPGLFLAVTRDLSEPLAYSLVAGALLALDRSGRRGLVVGTVLLALAALARESTLLFAAAAAWGIIHDAPGKREHRVRVALSVLAGAALPLVVLKLGLAAWLGSFGNVEGARPSLVPLGGLLADWPPGLRSLEQVLSVVAPAFGILLVAILAARRATAAVVALALNVVVLVVMLPTSSYVEYPASGRIVTGVVLAGMACLPSIDAAGRLNQAWVSIALWLSPWYWLLPQVFER